MRKAASKKAQRNWNHDLLFIFMSPHIYTSHFPLGTAIPFFSFFKECIFLLTESSEKICYE